MVWFVSVPFRAREPREPQLKERSGFDPRFFGQLLQGHPSDRTWWASHRDAETCSDLKSDGAISTSCEAFRFCQLLGFEGEIQTPTPPKSEEWWIDPRAEARCPAARVRTAAARRTTRCAAAASLRRWRRSRRSCARGKEGKEGGGRQASILVCYFICILVGVCVSHFLKGPLSIALDFLSSLALSDSRSGRTLTFPTKNEARGGGACPLTCT